MGGSFLPKQQQFYFTTGLDSTNIRKPLPATRWIVPNQEKPGRWFRMAPDMSDSAQYRWSK